MTNENEETVLDVLKGIREELEALRWTIGSGSDFKIYETTEERELSRKIDEEWKAKTKSKTQRVTFG